jgi:hypothetical protein
MNTCPFSALHNSFWLVGVLALFITACGGQLGPILGKDQGIALTPSVTATAPLARNPAVTGVTINTRITATFYKSMNPGGLNASSFTLACPSSTHISGSVS